MKHIHRFLDWCPLPTWFFEASVRFMLELTLLTVCAWPSITSTESRNAAIFAGVVRLLQGEITRKRVSIIGRATEKGLIPARPALAPEKEHELYVLGWLDDLSTYVLTVLTPIVLAIVGGGKIDVTLGLAVIATIVRTIHDRAVHPSWRASRVAWRGQF